MKKVFLYFLSFLFSAFILSACEPSKDENQEEQTRELSLRERIIANGYYEGSGVDNYTDFQAFFTDKTMMFIATIIDPESSFYGLSATSFSDEGWVVTETGNGKGTMLIKNRHSHSKDPKGFVAETTAEIRANGDTIIVGDYQLAVETLVLVAKK